MERRRRRLELESLDASQDGEVSTTHGTRRDLWLAEPYLISAGTESGLTSKQPAWYMCLHGVTETWVSASYCNQHLHESATVGSPRHGTLRRFPRL